MAPKLLFRYDRLHVWQSINKYDEFIFRLAEASGGLVPRQRSLHSSFCSWLDCQKISWSLVDTDRCIMALRGMLMKLQKVARLRRPAPKKYSHLDRLL